MSAIWNKVEQFAHSLEQKFKQTGQEVNSEHTGNYSWHNSIYSSDRYRRAHVEIVDFRNTHKIYILHCTVFPHFNDPSPIWGFDAVCGPSKITGAFHDFSSGGDSDHPMMQWFAVESAKLSWRKPRDLPPWARAIFSPAMIAAGNVNDILELDSLLDIGSRSIDFYLSRVGLTQESGLDYHMAQNRYCAYQKQNPHVINSMVSMGIDRGQMEQFVQEILFPETV